VGAVLRRLVKTPGRQVSRFSDFQVQVMKCCARFSTTPSFLSASKFSGLLRLQDAPGDFTPRRG
jgi:hypothetical protein